MRRVIALIVSAIACAGAAFASAPEAPLTDRALEARAQSLAREIRCVVCENEPVALSSADIAVDMRAAIRERVKAGDTDQQVRRFFAERYGEFVLLRPRFGIETLALWGAPFVLLLLGGGALFVMSRRMKADMEPHVVSDNGEDDQARAALEALTRSSPSRDT
jgi:cytochrome c-type biogenesis protein CcmH